MPKPIRLMLVDDDNKIHQGIAALVHETPNIELICQAYSGEQAIELCQSHTLDMILMDVIMPGISGTETTKIIRNKHPDLKVLALSGRTEYEYIKDMLDSGAIGYLVKTAIADDLIDTIRNAFSGNIVLSPQVAKTILSPPTPPLSNDFGLTEREKQVLELIAAGHTDSRIALELSISPATVRFHFNNILHKFNVETRSEILVLTAKARPV